MARRRSRSSSLLRRYGYPSNKQLRQETASFAGASVPTVKSIHRQYDRSQRDATGFTDALLSALQGVNTGVGDAYDTAQQQQSALDAATQTRLGDLGGGYAEGAQAAVGGIGDSAAGHLIASGAAERVAGAKQPGIAAGMGFLAHAGLQASEEEAIQKRQDAYRAAFAQILAQNQQNAFTRAMAQAQFHQAAHQFNATMAFNQAQAAQSQANTDRAFAEQQREFNISERDRRRAQGAAGLSPSEMRAQLGIVAGLAGAPPAETKQIPIYKDVGPWKDPNDHSKGRVQHIVGYKTVRVQGADTRDAAQKGIPFGDMLQQLILAGVSQPVAVMALEGLYGKYADAPPPSHAGQAYQSYMNYAYPHNSAGGGGAQTGRPHD